MHAKYADDLLSAACASEMESLMGSDRTALWMHGHVHDSFDYALRETRVVHHPRGDSPHSLNRTFSPDAVLEV